MDEMTRGTLLSKVIENFYPSVASLDWDGITRIHTHSILHEALASNQPSYPVSQPGQLLSQLANHTIQIPADLHLHNPIPGLFVVTCSRSSFEELRDLIGLNISARGIAILIPNGVDFILLPVENSSFDEEANINFRHELSHVLFKRLTLLGLAVSQEQEGLYRKVHIEIIDELLASICGENLPHAYSRTIVTREVSIPAHLEEVYYKIYDRVQVIRQEVELTQTACHEIIKTALESRSLNTLLMNLIELSVKLPKKAKPESDDNFPSGWGNV